MEHVYTHRAINTFSKSLKSSLHNLCLFLQGIAGPSGPIGPIGPPGLPVPFSDITLKYFMIYTNGNSKGS